MFFKIIREDWSHNKQFKMKVLVTWWRLSNKILSCSKPIKLIASPILIGYWVYSQILCSVELPIAVTCGRRLQVWHGVGLVLNPNVIIGDDCVLRNGVVIGNNGYSDGCPVLKNNVVVGANAVIVGQIEIGKNCVIGANSLVTENIEESTLVKLVGLIYKKIEMKN